MNFYVWSSIHEVSYLRLEKFPKEFDGKTYLLDEGKLLSDWVSKEIVFEAASGDTLVDIVPNTLGIKIVSDKVKQTLIKNNEANFEFLPLQILNQNGQLIEEPYYIANCLSIIACLDHTKSEYVIDALDKSQMDYISHLFLEEEKIDEEKMVFRLGELKTLILIHEKLIQSLKSAKCTGLKFIPTEEYGKLYREPDEDELLAAILKSQESENDGEQS